MDQQLLLGIALIVVGIAVGLIAAAVVVNRRIDQRERSGESAGEQAADQLAEPADQVGRAEREREVEVMTDGASEQPTSGLDEAAEPAGEVRTEKPSGERGSEQQAVPGPAAGAETEPQQQALDQVPAAGAIPAPEAEAGQQSLLGELHRDPKTGRLFFRSGGKEYRSATDIDDRAQRDRLAGAASEWADWFREAPRPAASAPKSPSGMVQAIDAILQRSLESSGVSTRGVRLIQDLSGGVKVLIGVKSYEVEEVPDEEIRRLIRQAVAEWEEQR